MIALQGKPNRTHIVAWMASVEPATISLPETCGCLRFMVALKTGCLKVQVPVGITCMEWILRCALLGVVVCVVCVLVCVLVWLHVCW